MQNAYLRAADVAAVDLPHLQELTLVEPTFCVGAAAGLVFSLSRHSPLLAVMIWELWMASDGCDMSAAVLLMHSLPRLRALTLEPLDEFDEEQSAEHHQALVAAFAQLRDWRPTLQVNASTA